MKIAENNKDNTDPKKPLFTVLIGKDKIPAPIAVPIIKKILLKNL